MLHNGWKSRVRNLSKADIAIKGSHRKIVINKWKSFESYI